MAGYIEKDRNGEFFNPASCTVEINPDDKVPVKTETDENLARWQWLISGWEKMSFKDKMALFLPLHYFMDLRDCERENLTDQININIVEWSYKHCRMVEGVKFDPDRQGIPNILVVFRPINPEVIPDNETRIAVRAWGLKFGFYNLLDNSTKKEWYFHKVV